MKPPHSLDEVAHGLCNQHIHAIGQLHALHRHRGGDHRHTVAHRHGDLALDAGAEAQRCQRDETAIQPWRQLGDAAVKFKPGRGQFATYRCGHIAQHVQHDRRQCLAHARQDLASQPADGVAVGRVAVAADEHHVTPLRVRATAAVHFMDVGKQLDPGLRQQLFQQCLLVRADHEADIGLLDQGQLAALGGLRLSRQRRVAGDLGGALLAQKVQIHRVEQQLRLRRLLAHQRGVLAGHGVPA